MRAKMTTLELLKHQLTLNKQELCAAHMHLNRCISTLEQAELMAIQVASQHPLAIMAQEHLQIAGTMLMTLNRALNELRTELSTIENNAKNDVARFYHFIQASQRYSSLFLKSNQAEAWGLMQNKIQKALEETSIHYKNQILAEMKTLASNRQRRAVKIKLFIQRLYELGDSLEKACEKRQHNQHTQLLAEQIQKKVEKKAQCVREVQRYQQILNNILMLEQQVDVVPARFHCELVQNYIHSMQQEQLDLLAKIKIFTNPGNAVNDLLLEVDEAPKKRRRNTRS